MRLYMALSSLTLTGNDISSTILSASAKARLKADMMTTGWIFRSSCGRACASISPAEDRQPESQHSEDLPDLIL